MTKAPLLLLVTGPSGAGKSTACEAFAETAPGTWAYVSQDAIRQFVKAGFASPVGEWTEEVGTQWDVSIKICADMARRYVEAGISCVVDGFAPPPMGDFDKWEEPFRGLDFKLVVLLPSEDTAVSRNAQRSGSACLEETMVRNDHRWFSAWHDEPTATIIDSTELSPSQVVKTMRSFIKGE